MSVGYWLLVRDRILQRQRDTEGRLKTFVEAVIDDEAQCKACKDTLGNLLWHDFDEFLTSIQMTLKAGLEE